MIYFIASRPLVYGYNYMSGYLSLRLDLLSVWIIAIHETGQMTLSTLNIEST